MRCEQPLAVIILGILALGRVHRGRLAVRREWVRARAARARLRTDFRLRRQVSEPLLGSTPRLPRWRIQAGPPRRFMVALTNVTARKRAEQERDRLLLAERAAVRDLTDQTERLNALLAAAIPGVLVLDEHGVIVQANQSLCDLLGMAEPPATLTGVSVERLRGPAGRTFSQPAEVVDRIAGYYTRRERVEGLRVRRGAACSVRLLAGTGRQRDQSPGAALGHIRARSAGQERDHRGGRGLASRRAEEARRGSPSRTTSCASGGLTRFFTVSTAFPTLLLIVVRLIGTGPAIPTSRPGRHLANAGNGSPASRRSARQPDQWHVRWAGAAPVAEVMTGAVQHRDAGGDPAGVTLADGPARRRCWRPGAVHDRQPDRQRDQIHRRGRAGAVTASAAGREADRRRTPGSFPRMRSAPCLVAFADL